MLYIQFDGVPQGGSISSALLVLALRGLEETVKSVTSRRKDKVNVILYADDFVITGATKEVLENKVMPTVRTFLKECGLELSIEKTKITHIDKGFDFLGFNVRKYKGKLLIKPSKRNVKGFLRKIQELIKSHKTVKMIDLIHYLNPKIRGWTNYYRHAVSKATFSYVDHNIFKAIIQWVNRRHPNKSAKWKYDKYFRNNGIKRWIFSVKVKNKKGQSKVVDLFKASELPIRRHVKIKAEATPYDLKYTDYFLKRERLKQSVQILDRKFLMSKLRLSSTKTTKQLGHSANGL